MAFPSKRRWLALAAGACILVLAAACSSPQAPAPEDDGAGTPEPEAAAEPVTIRVVSAWAEGNTMNDALVMLQERVREASGGRLVIEWGGGPEAIPSAQLAEALRNGVVDMAWTAHTYNVSQIPVVEGAKLSRLTPWEERDTGAFDFYQRVYEEGLNAHYLGRGTPGLTYNLYTTVPISGTADFQGLVIRVTPAYSAFVTALGASPVTTDPGEVYTALERGMVQGYGWPSVGIADFGWDEATRFIIDPPFYQVDVMAALSRAAWEALPADLQEVLTQAMQEVEREAHAHFQDLVAQDRAALQEKGIEVTTLPPAEAETYLNLAYEAGWEQVTARDPELAPELRRLLEQ